MTRACVTRLLAAAALATPPSAHPAPSETFVEWVRCLLNERPAASESTNENHVVVAKKKPAEVEPTPQPDIFVEAEFYLKLHATPWSHFCFGLGCLHTIVPVQQVGWPHVQAQKMSKHEHVCGGNSRGARRLNVHGCLINQKAYHKKSRIHNGQEKKLYEKKIKNWRKMENTEYREIPGALDEGR